MAGSEALRAAALLGILALIWFNLLTLPLLALLGFVAVCGTVAYSVAAPALVPPFTGYRPAVAAISQLRGSNWPRTVAFASGPALGRRAGRMGWRGAGVWVCRHAFHDRSRSAFRNLRTRAGVGAEAASAAGNPRRRRFRCFNISCCGRYSQRQFIFNTGSFLVLAIFVPYAIRHLGLSASGVGTVLAMYGVGMVVGALSADGG